MKRGAVAALLGSALMLTLTAAGAKPAATGPLLRCELTYAGSTQTLEARPVADPYPVASVDVGGRFRFKAVMVSTGKGIDYIKLYAYLETRDKPVLIQEAKYLPPFRTTATPYELTGVQYLYGGPVERELIYRCTLQGVAR